jgi:hypothetical protein
MMRSECDREEYWVDITPDMAVEATRGKNIIEGECFKYTVVDLHPHKDFMGIKGEKGFQAFLNQHGFIDGVDYRYDKVVSKQHGDFYDFIFWNTGETVDVVTTDPNQPYANVLVPDHKYYKTRLDKKTGKMVPVHCDYFVLMKQKGDRFQIVGYALWKQVQDAEWTNLKSKHSGKITPTKIVNNGELHDVGVLLERIKPGTFHSKSCPIPQPQGQQQSQEKVYMQDFM